MSQPTRVFFTAAQSCIKILRSGGGSTPTPDLLQEFSKGAAAAAAAARVSPRCCREL